MFEIMIDLTHVVLAGVCVFMFALCWTDRIRANRQETRLIKALLSKDAEEYQKSLVTPSDKMKELKAEAKLAQDISEMAILQKQQSSIDTGITDIG
jgi:cell division protein FtsX